MGVELDEREVEETISKRKDLFFPDERHPRGRDWSDSDITKSNYFNHLLKELTYWSINLKEAAKHHCWRQGLVTWIQMAAWLRGQGETLPDSLICLSLFKSFGDSASPLLIFSCLVCVCCLYTFLMVSGMALINSLTGMAKSKKPLLVNSEKSKKMTPYKTIR